MVVSSNAGTPFADIGATGVRWWLQAYLPQDRELRRPAARARGRRRAPRPSSSPSTPPWSAPSTPPATRSSGTSSTPGWLRVNFDPGYADADRCREGDRPRRGRHRPGWPRPPGCRSWSRACCAPTTPAAAWTPASPPCGCPTTAGASSTGRPPPRASLPGVVDAVGGAAQVYVDGGIRSGLDVLAALALGADAVFLGRSPLLRAGRRGAAGSPGCSRSCRIEVVEALRLAGCRDLADTRGIAVPRGPQMASDLQKRRCGPHHDQCDLDIARGVP